MRKVVVANLTSQRVVNTPKRVEQNTERVKEIDRSATLMARIKRDECATLGDERKKEVFFFLFSTFFSFHFLFRQSFLFQHPQCLRPSFALLCESNL